MNLKLKKIFILSIVNIMLLFVISNNCNVVLADGYATFSDFDAEEGATTGVDKLVTNATGTVVSILRIAGVTIALLMLLVMAMKYMMAAPGDRADLKKHCVPYLVGAVIVFGVPNFISIIITIADKTFVATDGAAGGE